MTAGPVAVRRMACASALLGLLVGASVADAQPALSRVREPLRGNDFMAHQYPRASGLLSRTVYGWARDPAGRLWVGTEDGPYSSEGGRWRHEPAPPGALLPQVRDILFAADGGRWFATRNGAFVMRNGQWQHLGNNEGVPGPVVYSITETTLFDGTPRIVLGAIAGVCVVYGERCRAVPLPDGLGTNAYMVRTVTSGQGTQELWVASASGGVARLRNGTWTTFTNASGLMSSSAEDIAVTRSAQGVAVYVAGLAGVFELVTTPMGGEQFRLIPGSPRSVYRVAYVPRDQMPAELWVGTGGGIIMRWRQQQWDTVRVDGELVHGQVTLLHADVRSADTRAVYVGTRGDPFTRFSLAAVLRINLPGRAARDYVHSILQRPEPAFQGQSIIASTASGATLVDSMALTRLLIDPTDPLLVSTTSSYWGAIQPWARRRSDTLSIAAFPTPPRVNRDGPTDDITTNLVVMGHLGPVWFPSGKATLMPTPREVGLRQMRFMELFNGDSALVGTSNIGLLQWSGRAWVPLGIGGAVNTWGLLQTRHQDSLMIYAGGTNGIYVITAHGTTFDSIPRVQSAPSAWIDGLCEMATPAGALVFAFGERGTVVWRMRGATMPWQLLPRHFRRAMSTAKLARVHCGSDGRLYVGSSLGLLIGEITGADPDQWLIEGLAGREDGLPSSEITAIGTPFRNRLWVGTEYGPAIVDMDRVILPPVSPLAVRVAEYPGDSALPSGTVLSSTHGELRVDVWLDTYTREGESQFVIEWKREGWRTWFSERTSSTDPLWSSTPTRYLTDMQPGRYRLQVRGRDFAGRESDPVQWIAEVEPQWWESGPFLVAYVTLFVGLILSLHRWRVGVMQRGAAGVLESDRRLRASERKFRTLFDRAQDAHLLSASNRVVSANAASAALFSVSDPAELVGVPLSALMPESVPVEDTAPPRDLHIRRGEGVVPVQLTATSVETDEGEMQHLVLRDLTDVRAAERARERVESHLRERQRLEALGTLAGGIAHDFNNLLGVIRGNAELAEASVDDPVLTQEHLASIVDASDRARDLVRQILAFSRSPLPQEEPVDLSALLQSMKPLLRRMIPTSVQFELSGMEVPRIIVGDATPLQQVILNLVTNAEYAMRLQASGTLSMALSADVIPAGGPRPSGPVIRLEVRDTGIGIPSEVVERVFEPFFTTKPTGEGTGLGLAVLHGVVEAHGGRVRMESEEGRGTLVEIVFPASMHPERIEHGPAAVMPAARSRSRGARLIVVDDEPQVARVVERALVRSGYEVQVFTRSADALRAITADPDAVDLLLTDQTMPELTGDVLAEAVHRLVPQLPVLILTGFSHRLTPERVAEVGALAVLQKPIDLSSLEQAVEQALAGTYGVGVGAVAVSGSEGGG